MVLVSVSMSMLVAVVVVVVVSRVKSASEVPKMRGMDVFVAACDVQRRLGHSLQFCSKAVGHRDSTLGGMRLRHVPVELGGMGGGFGGGAGLVVWTGVLTVDAGEG